MKNIIFINACIREEDSRTLKIARGILFEIKKNHSVEEWDIANMDLKPYNRRDNPYINIGEEAKEYANKLASSDGVIIAAPFWDMSFPSILKVFLEKLSINDITFKDNGSTCLGISSCPFMFYITTRGMKILDDSSLEQATPYLRALCELWGIKEFDYVSAFNMDYCSQQEREKKIKDAILIGGAKIRKLLKE